MKMILPTFKIQKRNMNGTLTTLDHVNSEELDAFMNSKDYPQLLITREQDSKAISYYFDSFNGEYKRA